VILQVIQRYRGDNENFNRGWDEYKNGFGRVDKTTEYWLG